MNFDFNWQVRGHPIYLNEFSHFKYEYKRKSNSNNTNENENENEDDITNDLSLEKEQISEIKNLFNEIE